MGKVLENSIFGRHPHFQLEVKPWEHPVYDMNEHSHDFLEIVFVARGTGVNNIDNTPYEISQGDVYVINIGSSHSYSKGRNLKYYDILISPSFFSSSELEELKKVEGFIDLFYLESLFRHEDKFGARLHLSPSFAYEMENLVKALHRELSDMKNGYEIICRSYLTEFLACLCRYYVTQTRQKSLDEILSGRKKAIANVIEYVEKNLANAIDLGTMASLAFLSSSHFCTVFRENVGMTPIEFLTHFRLEKARELLNDPALSVAEVSYRVGFNDPAYFTRIFRKTGGQTPQAFRKKLLSVK